jgi:ketosteroid isomerase-like protein
MSQENVAVVRRIYEAAAHRDAAAVFASMTQRLRWISLEHPSGARRASLAAFSVSFVSTTRHGRTWTTATTNCSPSANSSISVATVSGRGRASGIELQLSDQAGLWTLRDGRVIRVVWFPTRAGALAAAGLSE